MIACLCKQQIPPLRGAPVGMTVIWRLGKDPVALACGLAGDEEAGGGCASVDGLMVLAGGDLEAFAGVEDEVVVLYFDCEFAFEDEEKLTCVDVRVTCLAGGGWHEFFDDAEFGCFDEVPAVAVACLWASPLVVFGGFCADDLGRQIFPMRRDGFPAGLRQKRKQDVRLRFSHADYRLAVGKARGQGVGVGELGFLQGSGIFYKG